MRLSAIEPVGIAPHDCRVCIASETAVGSGKDSPHLEADGALFIGALSADRRILRIAVMEEILGGKDVGVCCIPSCFPVGGKLQEEVVVVGVLFRPCKEIEEELPCVFVIVPEYAEIITHRAVLP